MAECAHHEVVQMGTGHLRCKSCGQIEPDPFWKGRPRKDPTGCPVCGHFLFRHMPECDIEGCNCAQTKAELVECDCDPDGHIATNCFLLGCREARRGEGAALDTPEDSDGL